MSEVVPFPMFSHIYLAALVGTDLDILFRGVDLLTYTHNYSINNIARESHYTHKIDELYILWACLFTKYDA